MKCVPLVFQNLKYRHFINYISNSKRRPSCFGHCFEWILYITPFPPYPFLTSFYNNSIADWQHLALLKQEEMSSQSIQSFCFHSSLVFSSRQFVLNQYHEGHNDTSKWLALMKKCSSKVWTPWTPSYETTISPPTPNCASYSSRVQEIKAVLRTIGLQVNVLIRCCC